MNNQRRVYCDHASTTPIRSEVLEVLNNTAKIHFANPSSLHFMGSESKNALKGARENFAEFLDCLPSEIYFTSGGTVSNNLAIHGLLAAQSGKSQIISSHMEHSSVWEYLQRLEQEKYQIDWLGVDSEGFLDMKALKKKISPKTALVTVIHANNEIGTIQDLAEIADICRSLGVPLHIDAVQSAGKIELNLKKLPGFITMSFSGHKFYGPKGVGLLFKSESTSMEASLFGGQQESGLYPGTENLPGIVGMCKAYQLALQEMQSEKARLSLMTQTLYKSLQEESFGHIQLNGPSDWAKRLPGLLNISCPGISSDQLVLELSLLGIAASGGSACSEGKIKSSRILSTLYGEDSELAKSGLRLSFGRENTEHDLALIRMALKQVLQKRKKP